MNQIHQPVLLKESVDYLITDPDGKYFDGTIGFGGHSKAFLERLSDKALIIGTDVDSSAFDFSRNRFEDDKRVRLYNFNFSKIGSIAALESVQGFDGIFADLGVSSFQLDNAQAGFTFRSEAPLDLRMDKSLKLSASDLLNIFSAEEIANIIYKFGEEKNSRKIAAMIVERRKVKKFSSTLDLVKIIESLVPPNYVVKSLTRVFQALRIYINNELETLEEFLKKCVGLLNKNGRMVVLTYHSLEDRIVKEIMKYETLSCICPKDFPVCRCGKEVRLKILTKKPVLPSEDEVRSNFRSRSAKLRAAERV